MARALDLHSRGQGFDSPILHKLRRKRKCKKGKKLKNFPTFKFLAFNLSKEFIDILKESRTIFCRC